MDYTVIKEIGRGGFGIVEKVRGADGQIYARKSLIVPPHLDATGMQRRFEREVKYQSAISHENVVQILAQDPSDKLSWFIMPLAECSLLDEMLVDRTLGENLHVVLFHVLAGLEEIHRRGYYHRDLKPGNILKLSYPDGAPRYALSDFGLMAVGEDASSTLTPSGIGGGTPAYQAPECAINFRRATTRSDIYSFGALLHDIFAPNPRRLPHEELSVPGKVGPVVEKCTRRYAHRRFKDIEQLREALFDALSDFTFTFQSTEEELVVGLLTSQAPLPNPEQWDRIFDFLDISLQDDRPVQNIFAL